MVKKVTHLEYALVGGDLSIPRLINGLWQLAGGHDQEVDVAAAADNMGALFSRGLNCFDCADHYGPSEFVIGIRHAQSPGSVVAFTKWCPAEDGDKSLRRAEEAVNLALSGLNQDRIALLQYHVWDYSDDTYLHNIANLRTLQSRDKIQHIGLTNVDAAHLELLLSSGFEIASNQVSCSVIDRRLIRGRLGQLCLQHGVAVLAYGTLLGGFLSEKWLDQPEPVDSEALNWSLRKYLRFIRAAGGWTALQAVLKALSLVALKHTVSIAAVAMRWVLDLPAVSAIIVGTRLSAGSEEYIDRNLEAFAFQLDDSDCAAIEIAQTNLSDVPGDCGDEYRRPPYLTATGDLSHHLKPSEHARDVDQAIAQGRRIEYSSGSKWEPIAGYCRAVRTQNTIRVSGTTATSPIPSIPVLGGSSVGAQTTAVLDLIERAIRQLGGDMADVVRTRVIVQREEDVEEISRAHGHRFRCLGVRPANTLVIAGIVGDEYLVEIEAEAEIGSGSVTAMLI